MLDQKPEICFVLIFNHTWKKKKKVDMSSNVFSVSALSSFLWDSSYT